MLRAAANGIQEVGIQEEAVQEPQSLQDFKRRTGDKLHDVRCPKHHQAPRVIFRGSTLRDVSIQMSGCCETLIEMANRAIAQRPNAL